MGAYAASAATAAAWAAAAAPSPRLRRAFGSCLDEKPMSVGNLGLLFMLLFFIYAALGVELFGRLECSEDNPCEGLSRHATFSNFGMAFLTLFRVSTGDNWNGIMKDTLRECVREDKHCLTYLPAISPIYFVTFVLVAQFVLVNVVVAVLMKHLEESNKEAREDAEMDAELELEMAQGPPAPAAPPSPGPGPEAPRLPGARKVSVSRMLSLPKDSYMFPPVAPASAPHPHPLQEVEIETYVGTTSSGVTSVEHVPPAQPCASLQASSASSSPARGSSALLTLPPRGAARSPSVSRLLCRQEALHANSLEAQADGPADCGLDVGEPDGKTPTRQASLGDSLRSPPRSPRPASIRARKHAFGQACISSQLQAPGGEGAEAPDPADEEVSHITSSARSPSPEARGVVAGKPGLCRLYGADARGLLDQPGRADPLRRPSGEQGGGDSRSEPGEGKAQALEAEPALGSRRKKKMSPPCISIDPPVEDEGAAWPPAAEGGSTTLRRRTPSCEPVEGSGVDPTGKGERWGQAPCRAEHLTIPSFAFEPLDVGGPSGDLFLDSGHRAAPEPSASSGVSAPAEPHKTESPVPSGDPPEKGWGLYLNVPESPPKKAGSLAASPTPGDSAEEPV